MIRAMEIPDVMSVIEIDKSVLNSNWTEVLYRTELLDLNTWAYVYELNSEVIGFIIAKFMGDTSDLLQIAVNADYLHKGIGYEMLRYVWCKLREQGVESILLEVFSGNKRAIEFYDKFGFETVNIRKNYYGNGKDALLMKLKVDINDNMCD